MPKKYKKSARGFPGSNMGSRRIPNGAIFRNSFAVGDDIDPRVSLQHLFEMFSGKLEEDVVTMIFTECAYDVEQTLETLMALTNDGDSPATYPTISNTNNMNYSPPTEQPHFFVAQSAHSPQNQEFIDVSSSNSNGPYSCQGFNSLQNQFSMGEMPMYVPQYETIVEDESSKQVLPDLLYQSQPVAASSFGNTPNFGNGYPFYPAAVNYSPPLHNPVGYSSFGPTNLQFSPTFVTPYASFYTKTSNYNYIPPQPPPPINVNNHRSSNSKTDKSSANINDVSSKIIDGKQVLVILRGLPGSGKSTLAKDLKFSGQIFSTDDYFVRNYKYHFDGSKLPEAHKWNRQRTLNALERNVTPIIIDNTNTEAWEMLPYVKLGMQFNYEIHILEPSTSWKFNSNKLARRNTHAVSKDRIDKMVERYDHTITVESLKNHINRFSKSNLKRSTIRGDDGTDDRTSTDKVSTAKSSQRNAENLNSVSLEVVVHREDTEDISSDIPKVNVSKEDIPEAEDVPSDNVKVEDVSSDIIKVEDVSADMPNENHTVDKDPNKDTKLRFQELDKIDDIDELKLLVQDDSEESVAQSLNRESSTSSQDVSGWEAITEHDEDFLWKGGYSRESSVGAFESNDNVIIKSHIEIMPNHNEWDIVKNSEGESISNTNNEDSFSSIQKDFDLPKPQRDAFAKDITVLKISGENVCNANDIKLNINNTRSSTDAWDNISCWDSKNDFPDSNDKKSQANQIVVPDSLEPKPCRKSEISMKKSILQDNRGTNEYDDAISHNFSVSSGGIGDRSSSFSILRENSIDCDWQLPEYPSEDMSDNSVLSFQHIAVPTIHTQTQTEPSDFLLLHRLETNELFITSMKTLMASTENTSKECKTNCKPIEDNSFHFSHYDKSTTTEDDLFALDINSREQIKVLQSCFPEIQIEDLQHLLQICHNDSSWLSSILLEWGYKYNVPDLNLEVFHSRKGNSSENISESQGVSASSLELAHTAVNADDLNLKSAGQLENHDSIDSLAVDIPETFQLVLDPMFADKLQKVFGPLTENLSGQLSDKFRSLTIDSAVAKIIFEKWKENILSMDHASDKSIDRDFNMSFGDTSKPCNKSKQNHSSSASPFVYSSVPESLSEIMDMEYALQMHQNTKLKSRSSNDIAVTLKRKKLHGMFPGVDPVALDNIFDSNNYSLEETLKILEADIGMPAKEIKSKLPIDPYEDFTTENWLSWVHSDGSLTAEEAESTSLAANSTPEAEHWRAEAAMHYQMRQECIAKAQSAYCRGMKEVASFYAQKGDFHGTKFKHANKAASEIILQNKNKSTDSLVLDLHGLYIQEAVPVLRRFLKTQREKILQSTNEAQTVSVITGRGAHSLRGAKLRPSVMKFLISAGYRYDEINLGVFNVYLSASQR